MHFADSRCFSLPISPSVRLSSVAEDTIRAYFESRLVLLEPVFPLACHRLCEGADFSLEFGFKSQPQPEGKTQTANLEVINPVNEGSLDVQTTLWETSKTLSIFFILPSCPFSQYLSLPHILGSGILLFIFHANFLNEITARLCGPCSVHAVVLNDKFQLPIFLVGS